MTKLQLSPLAAGYAAGPQEDINEVKLQGGLPRTRLDVLGAARMVNIQWLASGTDATYLMSFYRANKGKTFEIDLVLEDDQLIEYTAMFSSAGLSLSGVSGLNKTFSAQLWAKIPLPDTDFDASVVDLIAAYGDDYSGVLNELDVLVNTKWGSGG